LLISNQGETILFKKTFSSKKPNHYIEKLPNGKNAAQAHNLYKFIVIYGNLNKI
jgi:hypothetical protein